LVSVSMAEIGSLAADQSKGIADTFVQYIPLHAWHILVMCSIASIRATKEGVMTAKSPTRRDVLDTSAAAGAVGLLPEQFAAAADNTTIQPFHNRVPEEALVDLHRRVEATRWPDRETVFDRSQGAQLATMQELARYWAKENDWRKVEARLNAVPQFMTEIDGLDIHFVHRPSPERCGRRSNRSANQPKRRTART
jgi:hypothetical protein